MAENRLTKKWLSNHFSYSWWKYLAVLIISVIVIDMVFTSTAYRPPEEKKMELYVCNSYCDTIKLTEALKPEYFARHPDQEEFSVANINLTSEDMYAQMQFSTYVAAQQGDVFLMPISEIERYTSEGADDWFIELTPFIESGVIQVGDMDLTSGMYLAADGTQGLYGIPADSLYGLMDFGNNPAKSMLCVASFSGNEANAASLINMLLEMYQGEKPQAQEGVSLPAAIF